MRSMRLLTLALLALGSGTACERVVAPGETLTLAQGESIVGSLGSDETPGKPAVRVQRLGRLDVIAADLTGGAALATTPGILPFAGQGVVAGEAEVNVFGGTITGGPVLLNGATGAFNASDGMLISFGRLNISGGRVRGGEVPSPGNPGMGVRAVESTVTVTGGDIDRIGFVHSRGFLLGGRIGTVSIGPIVFIEGPPPGPRRTSCVELHGGQIEGPIVLLNADLFISGSSFNLPFGEIREPSPGAGQQLRLQGVLEDGSAIDVLIARGLGRLVLVRTPPTGPREIVAGVFCPPLPPRF
jgi:hypothetical protein